MDGSPKEMQRTSPGRRCFVCNGEEWATQRKPRTIQVDVPPYHRAYPWRWRKVEHRPSHRRASCPTRWSWPPANKRHKCEVWFHRPIPPMGRCGVADHVLEWSQDSRSELHDTRALHHCTVRHRLAIAMHPMRGVSWIDYGYISSEIHRH